MFYKGPTSSFSLNTLISPFPILHFPPSKKEQKKIIFFVAITPLFFFLDPILPHTPTLFSSPLRKTQSFSPLRRHSLSYWSGCAGNEMNLSSLFGSLGE